MDIDQFLEKIEKHKLDINIDNVKKALFLAQKAHSSQLRKSKEPYIVHPLNVASNLLDYNLDEDAIIAGLLHDTIEDTNISEEDITAQFGSKVTSLVVGVTKLNNINFVSAEEAKLESFRRFLLASIKDIRVLIIKLFDRLDNMRTIKYIKDSTKRKSIALETVNIYAPMAERISLHKVKEELEDLAFAVLEAKSRQFILNMVKKTVETSETSVSNTIADIENMLHDHEIFFLDVQGRVKQPYSIWNKLKQKSIRFENIFDIIAFRIITNTVEDCYKVLYVLHTKYKAKFEKFKDYISYPKLNNYQSIHTTVYLSISNNISAEFQIRTKEMHEFSEIGIAAHYNYKNPLNILSDVNNYSWLTTFLDKIQKGNLSIEDIHEYSNLSIYTKEIFVFTPKGEIISLPKGSTALDFAYEIHSNIGNKCHKIKINNLIKPIFTELKTGDKVEVITKEDQKPEVSWLSFANTGLAKLSIKKSIKQKLNKDLKERALSLIEYYFAKFRLDFQPEFIKRVMAKMNIKLEYIFFEKIVDGSIDMLKVKEIIYPNHYISAEIYNKDTSLIDLELKTTFSTNIYFTNCCYPIYGDIIVAVLLAKNKIEIHHCNCEILYSDNISRLSILPATWITNIFSDDITYTAKIRVILENESDALASIVNIMTKNNINIHKINHSRHNFSLSNQWTNEIIFSIKDTEHLDSIMISLRESPFIKSIERCYN